MQPLRAIRTSERTISGCCITAGLGNNTLPLNLLVTTDCFCNVADSGQADMLSVDALLIQQPQLPEIWRRLNHSVQVPLIVGVLVFEP